METYDHAPKRAEDNFIFRAFIGSLVVHSLLNFLHMSEPKQKVELRHDAITVDLTTLPEKAKALPPVKPVIAKKVVAKQAVAKAKPVKPVPKDAGTVNRVAESKALGDLKATKVVPNVQKGDPASLIKTAYKPGTEFRKLPSAQIGTGGNSNQVSATTSGGSGDSYKAPNFAVKSLTASTSGKRYAIKTIDDGGSGTGSGGGIGDGMGRGFGNGVITGTSNGTIEKAKILTNMGSLTGSTVGVIGTSKGAAGLSQKGTVAVASVPSDTQILGSMDPDLIRRRLMEHLAQFRYCYQSELDQAKTDKFSGLLKLNFEIASTGKVDQVQVNGGEGINSQVKNCVAGVLRGIDFPEPQGGGRVEVKQPINFYSKYN